MHGTAAWYFAPKKNRYQLWADNGFFGFWWGQTDKTLSTRVLVADKYDYEENNDANKADKVI